jgi:hypothetical protein
MVHPRVLFEAAAGTQITSAYMVKEPASNSGLQALVITSDNKIFSTGGVKSSLLDKHGATAGKRVFYGAWVEPTSLVLQPNMSAMELLPPGEVLVGILLGADEYGNQTVVIATRSPTGKSGKLSTTCEELPPVSPSIDHVRHGFWRFSRN